MLHRSRGMLHLSELVSISLDDGGVDVAVRLGRPIALFYVCVSLRAPSPKQTMASTNSQQDQGMVDVPADVEHVSRAPSLASSDLSVLSATPEPEEKVLAAYWACHPFLLTRTAQDALFRYSELQSKLGTLYQDLGISTTLCGGIMKWKNATAYATESREETPPKAARTASIKHGASSRPVRSHMVSIPATPPNPQPKKTHLTVKDIEPIQTPVEFRRKNRGLPPSCLDVWRASESCKQLMDSIETSVLFDLQQPPDLPAFCTALNELEHSIRIAREETTPHNMQDEEAEAKVKAEAEAKAEANAARNIGLLLRAARLLEMDEGMDEQTRSGPLPLPSTGQSHGMPAGVADPHAESSVAPENPVKVEQV